MENCFDREIAFVSKGFDGTNHTRDIIKKTATFRDLDVTEKVQHKLHFKITSIFKSRPLNEVEVVLQPGEIRQAKVDDEVLYELTLKAVQILWVETQSFSARDKEEFLSDSGAILSFGTWFLTEKVLPFFPQLMRD